MNPNINKLMDKFGKAIQKDGYTQDIASEYQVKMNDLFIKLSQKTMELRHCKGCNQMKNHVYDNKNKRWSCCKCGFIEEVEDE